jgi:hypothetical protein
MPFCGRTCHQLSYLLGILHSITPKCFRTMIVIHNMTKLLFQFSDRNFGLILPTRMRFSCSLRQQILLDYFFPFSFCFFRGTVDHMICKTDQACKEHLLLYSWGKHLKILGQSQITDHRYNRSDFVWENNVSEYTSVFKWLTVLHMCLSRSKSAR